MQLSLLMAILATCTFCWYDLEEGRKVYRLSMAAYCDSSQLVEWKCSICKDAIELQNVQMFYNPDSPGVIGYMGVNKFLISRVLIFRGTINDTDSGWMSGLTSAKKDYPPKCGDKSCQVSSLILDNYLSVQTQFKQIYTDFDKVKKNYPFLIVAGIGLGGGYATLAAASLIARNERVDRLYTFGTPRIGDKQFATWFDKFYGNYGNRVKSRVTKFKDIVPLKPATADGFMHTKGEVYYSSSKRKTGYISCDESAGEDPKCASGQSIQSTDYDNHLDYFEYNFKADVSACRTASS